MANRICSDRVFVRAPVLRLASPAIDGDTVECLRDLLAQAEKGNLVGIAYVAIKKGRRYIVDTAGMCSRDRVLTRGMLADLHESLGTTREER